MNFFKKKRIISTEIGQLKPDLKKIKMSNSIVIGGMIAFGKSTLAKKLSENLTDSKVVYELNDEDQLMTLLLGKMYERTNNVLYGSVFQLYFVLNRFENYKNNCNDKYITIFDRSIFEDWLFAHENIIRPSVFGYYDSLWKDVATELIYEHGVPKLYVILTGTWELFKKRIFERNRTIEIENFNKNKTYFKKLLEIYEDYMINVCKDFGIDYILIDASKELDEKLNIVLEKIKTISQWHEKMNIHEINKIVNFVKTNDLIVEREVTALPSFPNKFINCMNEILNDIELNIINMLYGIGPYKTRKNYDEVSNETNLSIAKIKWYEKNSIKKIKDATKTIKFNMNRN